MRQTDVIHFISKMDIDNIYQKIGHLAILFSKMEYGIVSIIQNFINPTRGIHCDVHLNKELEVSSSGLARNLEYLEKLNRRSKTPSPLIDKLVTEIVKLKTLRNLLIHGHWETPYLEETGELIIVCLDRKERAEIKFQQGNFTSYMIWDIGKPNKIKYSDLIEAIDSAKQVVQQQEEILRHLKEN